MRTTLISMTAAACLLVNSTAQAAETKSCIPEENAEALIIYMLPGAIKTAQKKCSPVLPVEASLLQSDSDQFQKYVIASDAAWDDAKEAISSMAGSDLPEGLDVNLMKPLLDGLMTAMLADEIKPKHCENINQVYELLEPLPAENLGGLTLMLAKLGSKDDKKSKFNICRAPS